MEEIYKTIPHRPPFLFIDRIIEVTGEGAVAERTMRAEEPHFEGHYPGNPLMPGVLLCEAVFQTAAVYMMNRFSSDVREDRSKTPVLARISNAKFKQMVRPGDTIRIETTFTETLSKFHFMKGRVLLGDKTALTVEFALALLDA